MSRPPLTYAGVLAAQRAYLVHLADDGHPGIGISMNGAAEVTTAAGELTALSLGLCYPLEGRHVSPHYGACRHNLLTLDRRTPDLARVLGDVLPEVDPAGGDLDDLKNRLDVATADVFMDGIGTVGPRLREQLIELAAAAITYLRHLDHERTQP